MLYFEREHFSFIYIFFNLKDRINELRSLVWSIFWGKGIIIVFLQFRVIIVRSLFTVKNQSRITFLLTFVYAIK